MSPLVMPYFLGIPNPVVMILAGKQPKIQTYQESFCDIRPVASLPACWCHVCEMVQHVGQHGFVASRLGISGNYVRSIKVEVLKPTVLNSRVYRVQLASVSCGVLRHWIWLTQMCLVFVARKNVLVSCITFLGFWAACVNICPKKKRAFKAQIFHHILELLQK